VDRENPGAADGRSISVARRDEVGFRSESDRCAAWHYPPANATDAPCIVMAHGFGATRHYGLDAYARRFQARGYGVLVFDYRHFGDSEGAPRGLLSVRRQLADWSNAIAFAGALGYRRIVLWGTSFAGGHVLHTAAHTAGIAAVISQVPHLSGPASTSAVPFRTLLRLAIASLSDAALCRFGRRRFIAAFGPEGTLAAMSTLGAHESMLQLLPNDPAGKDGTSWREYFDRNNRVTAAALLQLLLYSPGRVVDRIRCPVLLQAGRQDETTPFGPARRASQRIPNCEFLAYDVGHFDVYRGDAFERTLRDQLRFLDRHLDS
jgi:uncharacterized protein